MGKQEKPKKIYILYAAIFIITVSLFYQYNFHTSTLEYTRYGKIKKTALLDCFPPKTMVEKKGKKKVLICEASGIVYLAKEKHAIIVHDKSVPTEIGSPIFKSLYSQDNEKLENNVHYLQAKAIHHAKKYEDITLTTDKQYVIATTAFDRIKKGQTGWDNYNSLVYWPINHPEGAKIVSLSKAKNSVHLREKFAQALGLSEPYYFKIEGLTALDNNQLLFGIREIGESYKKFNYTFKIISVSYSISDGKLTLNNDFKQHTLDADKTKKMGLSGLDYDANQQLLYILGSYEQKTDVGEKQLGGALWVLTLNAFNTNIKTTPHRILLEDKTPLLFSHKPEGITMLNPEQLLIIYDDDKELTAGKEVREPHQAAYSIIQLF